MAKTIGIKEFSRRLGLSPTTISHAVSGNRPVQEATRKLIFEKMKEWNYTPNLNAKRLVTNCSNLIAFVSEEGHPEEDSYQMQLLRHICRAIRKEHYDLLLDLRASDDEMRMSQLVERVRSRGVDGSIYLGYSFSEEELELLSSPQCPCVYVDSSVHKPQPNVSYLSVHEYDACQEAFGYLHAKGCRNILLVARHKKDRIWGLWHECLNQALWNNVDEIFTAEDELSSLHETLKVFENRKFDAIVARTIPQLNGVLLALKQLNLQPGKDVELVVHGNEPLSDASRLPASILGFSYQHLSEVAVQSLLKMIRTQELNPPVTIINEKFFPYQP